MTAGGEAPARGPVGGVPHGAALVALSRGGIALAVELKGALPGARVHALAARVADHGGGTDEVFTEAAAHLRRLFSAGTPIVAVCAAGIVVRALAPVIADKPAEPPVVAVAEDGSAALPLLGGHRGANALARAVAAHTGGVAAVTTAGDLGLGLALDDPPQGWRVANPGAAKAVTAALLAGEPVALRLEAGDGGWLSGAGLAFDERAPLAVRVTDRAGAADEGELVLHPPVLALGLGCERGAAADELVRLARDTLARNGLTEKAVACTASIDLKEDEPALHAVAEAFAVAVRFFDAAALEAETPRLAHPSDLVFRETGCHGVAEGAALAAAGPEGVLVVPKVKSGRATAAVARAPAPIDAGRAGRPRGALHVVGIGPGGDGWLTPEAAAALARATDIVGYGLYLDLIRERTAGKALHAAAIGEEETRVRRALDLAAGGRQVALVSSGDAGIYGLAALVFELLDGEDRPEWNQLEISIQPGISALQAAAARIGAPLGHDFCAVSLSDLLTPWDEIERRLRAAAAGDFVVALYNPASGRRRRQIEAARDILLGSRAPETPTVLARNLGRDGESLQVIPLAELSPDKADMVTLVLVGNSRTRALSRGDRLWVYTPRGYAARRAEGAESKARP
jgi:cobalt-precorrin 5A hydrolase/precorrin-3B C17-methyltransferase